MAGSGATRRVAEYEFDPRDQRVELPVQAVSIRAGRRGSRACPRVPGGRDAGFERPAPRCARYRPVQAAGRFSRNAATPSFLSSEAKQRQKRSRS